MIDGSFDQICNLWLYSISVQLLIISVLVCVVINVFNTAGDEVRENGHMPPSPSQQDDSDQQKVKRPALKMSYEEYKQMANLLVLHMRRIEDSVADGKFM